MKIVSQNTAEKISRVFKDRNIRYSLASTLIIIIIATVLLALNNTGATYEYNIGDISTEDIRVPKDIHYRKDDDTEIKKRRVAESVPVVFDRDSSVLMERIKLTGILFNTIITTLKDNPVLGTDDLTFQLMALKSRLPRYLTYNDEILLQLLSYGDPVELNKTVTRILIYIYDNKEMSILESPYLNPLKLQNKNVTIRIINTGTETEEISGTLDDLYTIHDMKKRVYTIGYSIAPNMPRKTLNAVTQIIVAGLKPNTYFNIEETQRRINEAMASVKPVMGLLKKGQTIVREGDTITLESLGKIRILNNYAESSNVSYISGIFLLQIIFVIIMGFFLVEYNRILIPDKQGAIVIFSLLVLYMLYTYMVARNEVLNNVNITFALLLPIPFVTMMIAILFNIYMAMIIGLHVVFFSTLIHGGDLVTIILSVSSAVLGVFVNYNVQRRTDFLRGGLILGVINSLVIIAAYLIQEIPAIIMFKNVQLALAHGILNSILVLGIFPLYESIFGITTKFKLLELADLNAEIFKKMLVEAPGTYHHSLLVSNMAETACKDVHADHLMARVGAFYHDIGKIEDAGMYIENKVTDPRARTLSPKYYSQLIISHINKGVNLARKHGLPPAVIAFIKEHHGKTTMTYFYHKALESMTDDETSEEISKVDFQYPGPRPQTKESAIVMLADSIEAASRSIQEPTQAKLEGLVRKIIYNKLNEGELEDTDLSMADLNTIQKSFLSILNGIYHTRIEYPDAEDVKTLEKKLEKNGQKKD